MLTNYKLSEQQEAVIDWVKNGEGSLNLIARAGCGKTSTLMEIAKVIKEPAYMGAFNKAIADEFQAKLKMQGSYHVDGRTIHSAGLAPWKKAYPKVEIDGRKCRGIAKQVVGGLSWDNKLVNALCSAVGYGKQQALGVTRPFTDAQAWQEIIDYYDLRDEIPGAYTTESFIEMAGKVYVRSLDLCDEVIDFDDMLLAPLYHRMPLRKYRWVMVDEAQDTNQARRLILFSMMGEGSRMIAVGDPAQAIYGFAGANSNSMDLIKEALGSQELPLSVTYRCPKAVVVLAQQWVPDITAHESAPEGSVTTIEHTKLWERGMFTPDDVILCRNTRPLVGIAQRLREAGTPCVVEGSNTQGLVALATKWGDNINLDRFLDHLDEYRAKEVAKWTAKGKEEKAESVGDRCDMLSDLAQDLMHHGRKYTRDLVNHIELLFGVNRREGEHILRLCTVHRSKGREWDRVFLIGRNRYMPSMFAHSEWEMEQERNLQYVAVTRAKKELVEVEVPFKSPESKKEWWER
jgi:superfamily I DNA/RNA helicase